jgi:hypothetical protein
VKRELNRPSALAGRFDFNRDSRVNALDLAAARGNLNRSLNGLTAAAPASAPAPASPPPPRPSAAALQSGRLAERVWDETAPGTLEESPA